jgi:peptide/nickel transport system ATP-binding protein
MPKGGASLSLSEGRTSGGLLESFKAGKVKMKLSLLRVEDLKKYFPLERGLFRRPRHFIHAVDGISFHIEKGEVLGLVGESGCGKTTTGKLLVRLLDPDEGRILFRASEDGGMDITQLKGEKLQLFRRRTQMIFQNPYESLNPRMTVLDTVLEPLSVHGIGTLRERREKVRYILEEVGLTPVNNFLFRYPHELSGGQRQRVAIARALVLEPSLIVADEPASMIDVSLRAGIMEIMLHLKEGFGVSYLYITHDLAVARYMCNRIAVMYLGKVVELGETEEVIQNPLHPYSRALISAIPVPDPEYKRKSIVIKGEITRPLDPPFYCRFYGRCHLGDDECRSLPHPPLQEKGKGHFVACYKV